jgi:hypothetical protein
MRDIKLAGCVNITKLVPSENEFTELGFLALLCGEL